MAEIDATTAGPADHAAQVPPGAAAALSAALDAAERIVGSQGVVRPGGDGRGLLGPNSGMFRERRLGGLIRPATPGQVARVVAAFDARPGAGPLHPISTGRNWGLGSREPAQDGAVVLDLGGLAAVRRLDPAAGWAVIEPGVTQGRLSRLLADSDRMLNVTVSAARTSVVGNALDRGVGLRRQRVDDLLGLEAVLPDGQLVRVGWWPDDRPTALYPHGLGPSLLPLFVQSDLGIVTAAVIRLLPRPQALRVVQLAFGPEVLADAVTVVRGWVSQGLVRGVTRIFDPDSGRAYGAGEGEFLVHLCVDGTAESVEALAGVIAKEADESALFSRVRQPGVLDRTNPDRDIAVLVENGYAGDPDTTDRLFEAKTGFPADEFDERAGFLFFLPVIPFTAAAVTRADALLAGVREETGARISAALHVLDADVVDYVVAIRFERAQGPQTAHRALDLLHQRFAQNGFVPYRLDVDHAHLADALRPDPSAAALARRLKDAIDPFGTIAPGRYGVRGRAAAR